MSGFFQRLLGGQQSPPPPPPAAVASAAAAADLSADDLLDVRFDDSDRGEAELAQLFDGYERALRFDRGVAHEMLLAFMDRFANSHAAWSPDPAALEAARAAAAAVAASAAAAASAQAGKGGGSTGAARAQMLLVTGCSGGHPRALLAATVEGLERMPKGLFPDALASAAAAAGGGGLAAAAVDSQAGEAAVLHAAGLPLLRALRVLLRSLHNRAVLCSLGALPALCSLVQHLVQKLQAAPAVLAVASSGSSSPGRARAGSPRPWPAGHPALLRLLLALLGEALQAVQQFAEAEAQQHSQAAVLASRGGSKAASHAAQAASATSASAAGAASAAARTAAAVAPLLERGLLQRCCEMLAACRRIQMYANGGSGGAGSWQAAGSEGHAEPDGRASALEAAAGELEQRSLRCILALQAASSGPSAAALLQQNGQALAALVQLLGWPLAAAEHQLPLSTAALSSSSDLSAAASAVVGPPAPAPTAALQEGHQHQQQQQGQLASVGSSELLQAAPSAERPASPPYVRVCCGSGLRPAAAEARLQLLAVTAVGAAARGGGSAALRVLQQQGCFLRLTQLLQWAALTFDGGAEEEAGGEPGEAAAAELAASEEGGRSASEPLGVELQRFFQALWGWQAGTNSSGAARALLYLQLGSVLNAFRPVPSPAEAAAMQAAVAAAAGESGRGSGAAAASAAQLALQQLQGSDLSFHQTAVAALWHASGGPGTSGSSRSSSSSSGDLDAAPAASLQCGCHLQEQTVLFAARLLGREQRVLPLLPPACQRLFEQQEEGEQQRLLGSPGGGAVGSSEALANLHALRAAGFWEVAFGPALFFWAEHASPGQPSPTPAAATAGGGGTDGTPAAPAALAELGPQREHLRQLSLVVLEAAATLPASSSSLPEVCALLRLLQQHPLRHAVVAAACRLLLRLLGSAPATTLAALQDQQLLAQLPRLLAVQQQQQAEAKQQAPAGEHAGAGLAVADEAGLEYAICAALDLLGAFISMHVSLQRAAVAAWEPVAALFSLLLRPAPASRRLALDNVLLLMQVPPAGEDDRLAKAALFTKYTETLPAAVPRWRQLGLPVLLELLGGMRAVVAGRWGSGGGGGLDRSSSGISSGSGRSSFDTGQGQAAAGNAKDRAYAQQLFAQVQAFLQVANCLNEDYPQEEGAALCCAVLDTLTALLAGSPASRRALAETVGYGMLLEAVLRRLGGSPPSRGLLLSALGLLLEESPGGSASPLRFTSTSIANPAATPLLLSLLRQAAWEDQLWGLAAIRELLLQGVHNLAAADAAGLNSQIISWLAEIVAEPSSSRPGSSGLPSSPGDAEGDEQEDEQQAAERRQRAALLQQQLLALLRLSASYSISARDLRSLLLLLKPGPGGRPPAHALALLEALAAMAARVTGPACFFNFCSGSALPGSATGKGLSPRAGGQGWDSGLHLPAPQQPSGIVCSASLGGGSAGGAGSPTAAGGGSSGAFLRLPKSGYSFSIWIRLEDGREAGDQLLLQPALQGAGQAPASAGPSSSEPGGYVPEVAGPVGVASDQAVYALLHQPQPGRSSEHHHPFPFHASAHQALQGVALAVRRLQPAASPRAAAGQAGQASQQQLVQLVAHCWAPKHGEAALPLQQPLLAGRWHHLAVTHSAGGPLSHSELCLFLDGQLQATARLRYPTIKEPLSSVCVGAGALLRPLRGQAGAALLFEDVLSPAQVAALHRLGPDYQSPLLAAESSGLLDQHPAAAASLSLGSAGAASAAAAGAAAGLLGGGAPPRLLLAFCPQLAAAANGADAQGGAAGAAGAAAAAGQHRPASRAIRDAVAGLPAALLPGTLLCRTRQPADMLHCLGGVAALLPLLDGTAAAGQDGQSAQAAEGGPDAGCGGLDSCVAAGVLCLLAAALQGSPSNQQAMQDVAGFALVAHLLEQQRSLLGPELLAAQRRLLAAVGESQPLSKAVLGNLLINLDLWSSASPAVQQQLLSLWSQLAAGEPFLVRSLLRPAQLLHHVRGWHFSGGAHARQHSRRRPASTAAGLSGHGQGQGQAESGGGAAGLQVSASAPTLGAGQAELDASEARQEGEVAGQEDSTGMLRKGYIQLACTLIAESAAASARRGGSAADALAGAASTPTAAGGAASGPSGSSFSARDEGLAADLQAALSLVADCCTAITAGSSGSGGDVPLLQELLSLLLLPLLRRDSLARLPLLACLHRQGGPALLLPLLRLEQQQLRLLGLRAITACLQGPEGAAAAMRGAQAGNGSGNGGQQGPGRGRSSIVEGLQGLRRSIQQQQQQQRGGQHGEQAAAEEEQEEEDVIAAAGRLLARFPLTAATRIALLELLCDGAPWQQIDSLAPAGPPLPGADLFARPGGEGVEDEDPSAAAAHIRVRHPAAAAVLLQAAAAPGCSLRERGAVLGMLCLLCESASLAEQARHANQDMLAAAPCCWQKLLLDCMSAAGGSGTGSTGSGKPSSGASSAEHAAVAGSAWRLLVVLLARGLAASSAGWERLRALVSLLKSQPDRLYTCPSGGGSTAGQGSPRAGSPRSRPVPAWNLLQELLADILQELLSAQAAESAALGPGGSAGASPRAGPAAAAAAAARAAAAGVHRVLAAGREHHQHAQQAQQAQQLPRRSTSDWADAWTHVSQWATEPYVGNAAALLSLLDDFLAGAVLAPPGGAVGPGGSALLWADPAAVAASAAAGSGTAGQAGQGPPAAAGDGIPLTAWQELGATPKQQPQFDGRLLALSWRFLDRLHSTGAAGSPGAGSSRSPADLLQRQPSSAMGRSSSEDEEQPAAAAAKAGGGGRAGLSEVQLLRHQQQRGLLLLQRLLLHAALHAAPELAQQAAAQAAQLLPPLLADAGGSERAAAEAAAARMQLFLAGLVQCHRGLLSRAAAAQQQESLLPLVLQQRLAACMAAAGAVAEAAPWAFRRQGLQRQGSEQPQTGQAATPPGQQQQQQGPRSLEDLLPLLDPQVVLSAARQQVLFSRHCAALHEAAVPALQRQLESAARLQQSLAAAAEEASQQRLGLLLAADRLRRAAGRQATEERRQVRQRQWRDLQRGLTSGRGLWAEEEDPSALHWKLDAVEDPSRRRLRLCRNFHFERYSDAPRGKGSSAALAGEGPSGRSGALDEDELLAVAASLAPGTSLAIAEAFEGLGLEDLPEEEDSICGEGGEEQHAGAGGASADASREQPQSQPQSPSHWAQEQQLEQAAAAGGGEEKANSSQPELQQGEAAQAAEAAPPAAAAAQAGAQAEPELPPAPSEQWRQEVQQAGQQAAAVEEQQTAPAASQAQPPAQLAAAAGSPGPASRPSQAQQAQREQQAAQQAQQAQQVQVLSSEDVEAPPPSARSGPGGAAAAAILSCRCQWVTPKRVVPGRLHITGSEVIFVGDMPGGGASLAPFISGAGASLEHGSSSMPPGGVLEEGGEEGGLGADADEGRKGGQPPRRKHQRWPLAGLTEVHHSRYLLQPTALELFQADRRSHALLNFPSHQAMKDAAAALQKARPTVAVYDRRRKLEWALRLQQRWVRREVSTFDYLMALNTLAGRTYSDLNQYPVFPWVLADYTSPSLDLNSPESFRDLSKPVGALNEKRLAFFLERFESLKADLGHHPASSSSGQASGQAGGHGGAHLPPFHYGSHYSSAGIVLFYLLRMEGFTKLNRALQGGRFDHGDRLFHSVAATWQNALDNTADVKELVPEFYYQPEFLRNSNDFDLGQRQDGAPVGDVALPPWASGSAEEFVRVMREALESEHVSAHLHHWIDLVFGTKQRGKAAEEAANVFYYLTYEGAADLDSIHDPALRAAVEEQILHFGQTPIQLFRRRHPPRGPAPPPSLNPLLNGPDAMRRSALAIPPPHRSGVALAQMWVVEGRVLHVFSDGAVSAARWYPSGRQDLAAFTFGTAGLLLDSSGASLDADPVPPRLLAGAWASAAADSLAGGGSGAGPGRRQLAPQYALVHGDRVVLSGGYWDGSLRAHSPEDGRLLQSLCYHKDAVSCLMASTDGGVVVTGSADTTLMVWDANPAFGRVTRGRQPAPLPLLPRPRATLHGHRDAVTCVAVSPELDLVVSGAADGTLLLHSLGSGRYVRSLSLPLGVPPTLLCLIPSSGCLVVHSHTDLQLHLFTVNCRHLVSADTHERLSSLAPTPDGRLLLVGGTSGLATLRWLHSLKPVLRFDAGRGPISCLALTPEGCFLAGTADGSMVLFAPDPRRRITQRFTLAT